MTKNAPQHLHYLNHSPLNTMVLMLLSLVVIFSLTGNGIASPVSMSVFGSKEVYNRNTKPFPKWNDMVKRYAQEFTKSAPKCETNRFNFCYYGDWELALDSIKEKSPVEQMTEVNALFNSLPYITDDYNWAMKDYWETPGQFLARYGDCEDYAIMKYYTLKRLGFAEENMRIVIVKDENLKVHHAILMVLMNDNLVVLDNQIQNTIGADKINHYRPVYSINEAGWWLHKS